MGNQAPGCDVRLEQAGLPSLEGSSGITGGKERVQIQDDTRNILTQGKVSNQVIRRVQKKTRPTCGGLGQGNPSLDGGSSSCLRGGCQDGRLDRQAGNLPEPSTMFSRSRCQARGPLAQSRFREIPRNGRNGFELWPDWRRIKVGTANLRQFGN